MHRRKVIEECDQKFEMYKPKITDVVEKVLTLQKKLIEPLGVVCGRLLRSFLIIHYTEKWPESLSQEDLVKIFSSKPATVITKQLGFYLHYKLIDMLREYREMLYGA